MAASVTNLRPCERERLAGDPETSASLLRDLARNATSRVRARLAANPSTPEEILAELWPWHPEAMVLNPRQDLEILTKGRAYLPDMGGYAIRRLFFALLAKGWVAEAKEWVIPAIEDRRLVAPLAKGAATLPLATDPDLAARIAVARSRWLSAAAARALARPRSVRIHAALAGSPSVLPDEVVARLASLQEPMTRARVAARKDAPREILARLAGNRSAIVRRNAGANPRLALPCLHELLRDKMRKVRLAALSNPSAMPEWLEEAAGRISGRSSSAPARSPGAGPNRPFWFTSPTGSVRSRAPRPSNRCFGWFAPVASRAGTSRSGRSRGWCEVAHDSAFRPANALHSGGMKWRVIAVGRPALAFARAGIEEYAARLRPYGDTEMVWVKEGANPAETARRILGHAKDARPVLLDERGRLHTTRSLLAEIEGWEAAGVKRVAVIVGGADGHPPELRQAVANAWALGRLTLQHELALLVWMEQLYRLHTLRAGSSYHRD